MGAKDVLAAIEGGRGFEKLFTDSVSVTDLKRNFAPDERKK